jgi:hypothetical protein
MQIITLFSIIKEINTSYKQEFFVLHTFISAVTTAKFLSDKMSYTVLEDHWNYIIVLNAHAPNEDNNDDTKYSLLQELEQQVSDHFPKYHMKLLLGDFMQVWGETIFSNQ